MRRWLRTIVEDEGAHHRIEAQDAGWRDGTRFSFAIVVAEAGNAGDSALIGHIAVKRSSPDASSAEMGNWTSAQARARGIAPRARESVANWTLDGGADGQLERLELLHGAGNHASCRVTNKCGFALDSVLAASRPGSRPPGTCTSAPQHPTRPTEAAEARNLLIRGTTGTLHGGRPGRPAAWCLEDTCNAVRSGGSSSMNSGRSYCCS